MRYQIYQNLPCPLLNIFTIGYAFDPSVTCFGPAVRDAYIIHYVISGKGWFNGNPVEAGQGFLIRPGTWEHYNSDSSDPWEYLWFYTKDPTIEQLLPVFHADPDTHIFHYGYVEAVRELSSFLLSHRQTIYSGYELLEFFLRLFKHQQEADRPKAPSSNAEIYIDAAEKHIHSNLHRQVTDSELADFLGVGQSYLFRIFKARFQKSPKQYILEQKLIYAQTLLQETDISITHIAYSVGFPDVLSFSKCFRGKLGVSPQNYRRQSRP